MKRSVSVTKPTERSREAGELGEEQHWDEVLGLPRDTIEGLYPSEPEDTEPVEMPEEAF